MVARVEPLERRALLATFTWQGAADGSFGDSTRWLDAQSQHGVPGPGDDAVLPAGSYTVTATSGASVNSINGGGSLRVSGGPFSVAATSSLNGLAVAAGAAFDVAGGTTTIGGTSTVAGDLDVATGATLGIAANASGFNLNAGATLTGRGTFSVASNLDVNAAVTAPKTLILDSNASAGILGTGTLTVPSGSTLDWRSGSMIGAGGATTVAAGATLLLDGGGAKELRDRALNHAGTAGNWSGTGEFDIDGSAIFTNSGTFAFSGDGRLGNASGQVAGTVANSGTLIKTSPAGSGTTVVVPALNNSGKIDVHSGVLDLSGGGSNTGNINTSANVATIEFSGLQYNLEPGTTVAGTGAALLYNGRIAVDASVTMPWLVAGNSTVAGSGSLTVTTFLSTDASTISTKGILTLPIGSAWRVAGSGTSTFLAGVYDAAATTIQDGGSLALNGVTFINAGVLTITPLANVNAATPLVLTSTTLMNSGTIAINASAGAATTTIVGDIRSIIKNSGQIGVSGGTLDFRAAGINTGAFNIPGGNVVFDSPWNFGAGSTVAGSGLIDVENALNVTANLHVPNLFMSSGATLYVGAASALTVDAFDAQGGTIGGGGVVAIPGKGSMTIEGQHPLAIDAVINNFGTLTWTGTGVVSLYNYGSIVNQAGGTFLALGDATMIGGVFNNVGTYTKTISAGGRTTLPHDFNNLPGATLNLGVGNILATGLINSGTINLAANTTLTVGLNYVQTNSGVLTSTFAGTPASGLFGRMVVAGSAYLDGEYDTLFGAGFTPSLPGTYQIITYTYHTGTFPRGTEPFGGGLLLSVLDREVDMLHTTIAAIGAGDYDPSLKVDVAVFRPSTAQWLIQPSFGGLQTPIPAFGATNLASIPVPGNYDGVDRTELAVFAPSNASWTILNPETNAVRTVYFGGRGWSISRSRVITTASGGRNWPSSRRARRPGRS